MGSVPPSRRFAHRGHPLHDPCAIAWLIDPSLFTHRHVHVHVECAGVARGRTVVDRWGRSGQPPNARLLETLHADRFFALLAERVATLP
jgi:inosine-uridine nucleoside N-ribohydrolase